MADENSSSSKYNPESLEDAMKIIAALEKRVGERDAAIADERKARESLAERMQAIEQAQKQRLEEAGNYRELLQQTRAELEGLTPFRDRATALEQIIREANEARISRLPEDRRGLVPVEYPPEKLQAWLAANEPVLLRPAAPSFDAGAGNNGMDRPAARTLTPEQKRAAVAFGISEADMLAQIEKRQRTESEE